MGYVCRGAVPVLLPYCGADGVGWEVEGKDGTAEVPSVFMIEMMFCGVDVT